MSNQFQSVKAYESTMVIPTYHLKPVNPNPCFENQYGIARIYPYPLLDDFNLRPKDKTYRALHIENRYLKVTVLPELGGRVYSVYDKVSQREVFYKNAVIKFAPLALRGAFFSGGIEYNFPIGHNVTTTETINWELRENSDGSASIYFGVIEQLSRMKWIVTLTLFPDRCALAQDVQIQNPSSLPGRYFYWCTPACEANSQTEFIYPFHRCRSYMWDGEVSWPKARVDLTPVGGKLETYVGVPTWPSLQMHTPIDIHFEKNIINQVSIFGSDVADDYFGTWQHSVNHGYAHVADHHEITGMKHWSWGDSGMSRMTQTSLTDDGSTYAETQCGLMQNQHDFDFLLPSQTYHWREWWLPLRGIGGLTCASTEIGAKIKLSKSGQVGRANLSLGLCAARPYEKVMVRITLQNKTLLEKQFSIKPEQPWIGTEVIGLKEIANHPLQLTVSDGKGNIILDYTWDREVSLEPPTKSKQNKKIPPADEQFELGLSHEKLERLEEAMQAYKQAILFDKLHAPSHLQLGLMYLRTADFKKSDEHFRQAVNANQMEANYYLGISSLYLGKTRRAEGYFNAVPTRVELSKAALIELGCIALGRKKWIEAINYFKLTIKKKPTPASASLLYAISLRKAGRVDEARRQLEGILQQDPLNHVALREMTFLTNDKTLKTQYQQKLKRMLTDDRQFSLDMACFYLHAGLLEEALSILLEESRKWDYPILAYLVADIYRKLGKNSEVIEWLDRAFNGSPDLVFPSRLEEVVSLESAINNKPGDYKAKYYLGNFLYAHQRYDDAIKLWEEAVKGLGSFDVIHRNLGIAYWKQRDDQKKAMKYFERGLELNPLNQELYLHLDDLYVTQKLNGKREALMEKMLQIEEPRHDVQKRIVVMMVDLGQYEQAIHKLTKENFIPLEMDQSFRNAYVKVFMRRAEVFIKEGKVEEAIADYQRTLEYPVNVGVGKPVVESNAEILFHLGCAYELIGRYDEAIAAWQRAANEYHLEGHPLYRFILMSLDKLNRFTELGYC